MKILKITLVSLLLITIFCALFLRIIPNYSNEYGFEIVSLSDYKKYKLGYCLKENRILSKDEIYKTIATDYLLKQLTISNMITDWRVKKYGIQQKNIYDIGYYKIDGLNFDNWFDSLKYFYNIGDKEQSFFNKLKSLKISAADYIKVDLNNHIVGFKKPILFIGTNGDELILLNNVLYVCDNYVKIGYYFYMFNHFYKFNDAFDNKQKELKKYHKKLNCDKLGIKFDNCGNLDYNVKEIFLNTRELLGG